MLKLLKALVVISILTVSSQALAFPKPATKPIISGGEIPWPLAHQYEITAENSGGLWLLEQKSGTRYYNVEILDQFEGMTFLRVSELDPNTFEVISWGEGFFKHEKPTTISVDYWSLYLDTNKKIKTDVGRYLYMYPSGDIGERPYMIRLVEVRTTINISLGLSIYPFGSTENNEHILGSRLQTKPLHCEPDVIPQEHSESLVCDLPEDPEKPVSPEEEPDEVEVIEI